MYRPADNPALFQIGLLRAIELNEADIPALQRFFETNPGYFIAVTGQPPRPDEAQCEFHDELPAGWPFTRRWLIGFMDPGGAMIGMAGVEGNARAERFWARAGYVEVRKRAGVEMGSLVNTLRIMVKLPAGGDLPDYLARVARDRPG